jgi:uncharacterized protein
MRYLQLAALFAAIVTLCGFSFPEPHRFVTDAAGLVSADDKRVLDIELAALEAATTWEVYVVTVSNLEGSTPERYAQDLFVHYGIGKKDANNGVLLLVAKDERKARIHTGYHAESVITDAVATRIVREQIAPKTKAGDWSGGIAAGARAVAAEIRGAHSGATPAKTASAAAAGLWGMCPETTVLVILIGASLLIALMVWWLRRSDERSSYRSGYGYSGSSSSSSSSFFDFGGSSSNSWGSSDSGGGGWGGGGDSGGGGGGDSGGGGGGGDI